MNKTGFENLRVYNLAEEIEDLIWEIVSKWDYFAKDTIGKQLVIELTPKLSAYINSISKKLENK